VRPLGRLFSREMNAPPRPPTSILYMWQANPPRTSPCFRTYTRPCPPHNALPSKELLRPGYVVECAEKHEDLWPRIRDF